MVGLWTKSVFSKPDPGSWILIMSHHKLKADNKGGVDETVRGREGSGETGAEVAILLLCQKRKFLSCTNKSFRIGKKKKFLGHTTK